MKTRIHEYQNKNVMMNKIILKTTLVAFLLLTFSCSKDDTLEQEQQQVTPPATVTNMSPLSGPKTTVVTFTGTNFGTDTNAVQVFFDGIEADILSTTDTEIKTVVPPRAFFGDVTIIINGTTFTDFNFNYEIIDIQVSTFAGSEVGGFSDGNGTNAEFGLPLNMILDTAGNLFVADAFAIRKITPNGDVTTFAGSNAPGFADGTGASAQFEFPTGIAIDSDNNLYIADSENHKIRKITPSGIVSTLAGGDQGFADGTASEAQFDTPAGIVIDATNTLYVSDAGNNKIRKITSDGSVTTIAGGDEGFADGNALNAQFNTPVGITLDSENNFYITDVLNNKIRKIDTNNQVTTIAGSTQGFTDGNGLNAQFHNPFNLAVDLLDNIYVTDLQNQKIRKISTTGQVTTIAGSDQGFADGTGTNAQFNGVLGLVVDANFDIYVADSNNTRIRKITQE